MTIQKTAANYDRDMYGALVDEYLGSSGFFNFGYWEKETRDPREASENLVEKLLAFFPRREGMILDVACGMGATTRHIARSWKPSQVVGINISRKQLQSSRANAPGCHFALMDAARLAFADEGFENLICVEAAFHFETREQFLREAYRVLRPGGRLALSDALWSQLPWRPELTLPRANDLPGLSAYRDLYRQAGFRDLEVIDATDEVWKGFRRNISRWGFRKALRRDLRREDIRRFGGELMGVLVQSFVIKRYLLVSATKAPATPHAE